MNLLLMNMTRGGGGGGGGGGGDGDSSVGGDGGGGSGGGGGGGRWCTMVQNSTILRHKIILFPTNLGVGEVSERVNE